LESTDQLWAVRKGEFSDDIRADRQGNIELVGGQKQIGFS
jgi:hypothetical protein